MAARFQASPQQSPGIVSARPVLNGGNKLHNRAVSSDTNVATYSSLSPAPGRSSAAQADSAFKPPPDDAGGRRQGLDGARPVPEHRNTVDTPISARDQKKGLFTKWRKTKKDEMHPSPDDEHSPASPNGPHSALYKAGHATSETSLIGKHKSIESLRSESFRRHRKYGRHRPIESSYSSRLMAGIIAWSMSARLRAPSNSKLSFS